MSLLPFILFISPFCAVVSTVEVVGVRHLVGDPDYRKVTLHWEAFARNGRNLPPFQVRYCELQTWGTQRCRLHKVDDEMQNEALLNKQFRAYSVDVDGLRMATTYSFEVRPVKARREDRSDDGDNVIVVPTKGFSARATQCLPHASEVEVSTGPYFAGRIAVEATDGERCAVEGEPDSQRDTYLLRINHEQCGSQVNETTVATYVIVQENLPILTHSTRRFLVLCSYQPETLTVRAGLSLPTHRGKGQSQAVPEPDSNQQSNSVRRSRHLRPARLEAPEPKVENTQTQQARLAPITIMLILTIVGISCMLAITYKWRRRTMAVIREQQSFPCDVTTISNDISRMDEQSAQPTSMTSQLSIPIQVQKDLDTNCKPETVC